MGKAPREVGLRKVDEGQHHRELSVEEAYGGKTQADVVERKILAPDGRESVKVLLGNLDRIQVDDERILLAFVTHSHHELHHLGEDL
jgi:hypothetical protein